MRIFLVPLAAALVWPAFAQVDSSPAAPAVVIKPLSEIGIYPERDASAQAVSLNESRIAAEISGRIEAIPVRVGERVAVGAVLARIECRDHELAHERANATLRAVRARLSLAQQQLVRARELGDRGFFSKEAVASRETEVQVLRAEGEQASTQLDAALRAVGKCSVRSPFAAIVRERLGQVGELATPGSPLVALSDAGRVEVSAQVQLRDAESLRAARDVRFVGDGGSTAVIWRESRPYIPAEFVVRREDRLGVFVEERGVARFHPLDAAQEGRPAPVDLPLGARIVVAGQLALRDGQPLAAPRKQPPGVP